MYTYRERESERKRERERERYWLFIGQLLVVYWPLTNEKGPLIELF
jgi:hypothetical protein